MAKLTQTEAKEMTPQEAWKMKRDAKDAERNFNADQLSDSQRKALMDAFTAIRGCDFSRLTVYLNYSKARRRLAHFAG